MVELDSLHQQVRPRRGHQDGRNMQGGQRKRIWWNVRCARFSDLPLPPPLPSPAHLQQRSVGQSVFASFFFDARGPNPPNSQNPSRKLDFLFVAMQFLDSSRGTLSKASLGASSSTRSRVLENQTFSFQTFLLEFSQGIFSDPFGALLCNQETSQTSV